MANTFNQPSWFWKMINQNHLKNDDVFTTEGMVFKIKNQIPRLVNKNSENQEQTSDIFGFKWHKRDTFENNITKHMGVWLKTKYGELGDDFLANFSEKPNLLDAGCGGAMSAMSYFEKYLDKINYVGVDISNAVDVAAQRFVEKNIKAGFLQCNLTKMPFKKNSFDIIFSEGVLHHTDNTFNALKSLCEYLKINGKIYFYIYKKKSPIREYTDDYIREKIQDISPEKAWEKLMPLTELGKLLGELNLEIDIKNKIDLLGIPSGKIDIQRLFYWHIFKIFYRPEMNIEEMNHINFDWYAPKNAFRQTPEEVREWCNEIRLDIEHEYVDEAGISIIAKKIN